MPLFSSFFFFFIVSNFGLPGTVNFIGEFFILTHFFNKIILFINICLFLAIFISSFYSIILFNKITFCNNNSFFYYILYDLNVFEFIILITLIFFIYIKGVFPFFFFDMLKNDLTYYFYSFLNI